MAVPHLDVRRAVRDALTDVPDGAMVLVACSGGADSLALAAGLAFEASKGAWQAGGVSLDHGLQMGSSNRARSVASTMVNLGLDPVETIHVDSSTGGAGPEGNARAARYRALDAAALRHQAAAVLLGHTRDDQAETVLLGLTRGSGARSLGGMPNRIGVYRRPLLQLPRHIVREAVPDGLIPWEDPQNDDPAFARARVRKSVLPTLESELGPGVTAALARSGDLLRADADALDELAAQADGNVRTADGGLLIAELHALPQAIRWRVLRRAAIAAGSPPTDLTAAHVESVDALVTAWRGQVGIDLPGGIRAARSEGVVSFTRLEQHTQDPRT